MDKLIRSVSRTKYEAFFIYTVLQINPEIIDTNWYYKLLVQLVQLLP